MTVSRLFPWGLGCLLLLTAPFLTAAPEGILARGVFQQKSKRLEGSFTIRQSNGKRVLVFDENFAAKAGPDLQVILSPLSLDEANGKNAAGTGSVSLAPLKRTSGGQSYDLPADLDLAEFRSVLIHCVKYAVLWGGAPLGYP